MIGFNPYRVFKFVATVQLAIELARLAQFQSLSGFQVRCNGMEGEAAKGVQKVSIPIGFSSSLQQCWRQSVGHGRVVSIPIGFSSSLQPMLSI